MLTNISDLAISGKCESATVKEVTAKNGEKKKVADFVVKIKEVAKAYDKTPLEPGQNFSFTAIGKRTCEPKQDYFFFLEDVGPSSAVGGSNLWIFVSGARGIYKIEKDAQGKNVLTNKYNNQDLMKGMTKVISGPRATGVGVKATSKEIEATKRKGPIEEKSFVDMIQKIEEINRKSK